MNVKLNLSGLGKIKLAFHTVQAILIFITICVFIAMASMKGNSGGSGIFFGILCFGSIPVLIYMTGVPMWERTRKFANLFAFLALDSIFAIFWLAGWAALVAWVRAGQRSGAEKKKLPRAQGNCTTFNEDFGIESKCKLANTCVGFGVVIFALFVGTAVISYLYFRKVRNNKDGSITEPWLGKSTSYKPADPEAAAGDNAWSADMHEDNAYGAQHNVRRSSTGTDRGGDKEEDEYRLLQGSTDPAGHAPHETDTGYGRQSGQPWEESSYGRPGREEDDDVAYHGGGAAAPPYSASAGRPSDQYGPATDYERPGRGGDRTSFPAAPYGYDRGVEGRQ